MAVPTYDQFIEPILRYLEAHTGGVAARDAHDAAAASLGLTDIERAELLPSGMQAVYKNRAGWAHDRLKRHGYSSSPKRGFWKLTGAGLDFAKRSPSPLPAELVERLAADKNDVRLRTAGAATHVEPSVAAPSIVASPDDRLESALDELRQTVTAELLETLAQVSPQFFETIVLDVLHSMGYGTSRQDLQRVGRTGDGGIDGVISLDRLGLEKVYVQAKRWQGSVGRPDIQGFYGALAGRRANKGVFITTSSFSQQAVEFAASVEGIVLVDGAKLAAHMIEYEVGVTSRAVKIPKLDSDYFEE